MTTATRIGGSRNRWLSGSTRGTPIQIATSGAVGVTTTTGIHAMDGGNPDSGNFQDIVYLEAHNNSKSETVDFVCVANPPSVSAADRTASSLTFTLSPGETRVILDNVTFGGDASGNALGIEGHVINPTHVNLVSVYGGATQIEQSGD